MTAKSTTSFLLAKSQRLSWSLMGIVVITTAVLTGVITRDLKRCVWFALAPLPGLVLAERWRVYQLHHQQTQWQSSLQETIQHQEARLLELEHYEGQLNQAIAIAQEVNQGLQSDNQTLKSEQFSLGQQVSGLKQRRDKLRSQFAALKLQKQQLEREITTLTQAVQQGDRHKQTIEKNLRDSSQQLQQIEHSCHAIQGELGHLSQAIFDKQQQHQILSQALAELEDHCQTLQHRQASLTAHASQLVNQIQTLETQQVSLRRTHDSLVTEVGGLKDYKQTLAKDIAEQERQKREIEVCLTYLRHEYDQIQTEIADINRQALAIDEQLTPSGLS